MRKFESGTIVLVAGTDGVVDEFSTARMYVAREKHLVETLLPRTAAGGVVYHSIRGGTTVWTPEFDKSRSNGGGVTGRGDSEHWEFRRSSTSVCQKKCDGECAYGCPNCEFSQKTWVDDRSVL
jgi:hypothetical protein